MLSFEQFKEMELIVATIKEVEEHPNADKLYVLKLDTGAEELKQVVAGIKKYYTKEELNGKQVVLVNNLEPVILRGVESQGMILAASDDDGVSVLSAQRVMRPGSRVK